MASITNNIWIVGYGNIGRRVADLYQSQGIQTSITARSKESLEKAKSVNLSAFKLNLDLVNELPDMEGANLFYFVPPPRQGRQDTRILNFLEHVADQAQRIVLISTTGVYGDCNGDWIDETQAIKPVADRAWRRVDAEQQLENWAEKYQREFVILRVPGIYAEDRLPVARLKKGLPMVNKAESPWTNRIHADDLAAICYQAMEASTISNEIFNVSDGHPSTMTEYFNQVADYSGLPRPPQISLQQAEKELSPGMMSYMKESRRISNKKMLESLDIQLHYPSLADCLKKKHKTPLFTNYSELKTKDEKPS